MPIGIVGLYPHQIDALKKKQLPYDLEFLESEKIHSSDAILGFANRMNRVLIMRNGTQRKYYHGLKLPHMTLVAGSTGSLIKELGRFTPTPQLGQVMNEVLVKAKATAKSAPKDTMVDPQGVKTVPVKVSQEQLDLDKKDLQGAIIGDKVPVTLPMGAPPLLYRRYTTPDLLAMSQYKWSPTARREIIRDSGQFSHDEIQKVPLGTPVRYMRPAGIPDARWYQRFHSVLNRLQKENVGIGIYHYEHYTDVEVLRNGRYALRAVVAPKILSLLPREANVFGYEWKEDVALVDTFENGNANFDILDGAVVGDVVRLMKPAIPMVMFENRLYANRRDLAKRGMTIEVVVYEKYADLCLVAESADRVEKRGTGQGATNSFGILRGPKAAQDEPAVDSKEPTPPASHVAPEPHPETPVAPQEAVNPPDEIPTPKDGALGLNTSEECRQFWREVFLIEFKDNDDVESAMETTDKVVLAYQKRFKL